MSDVKEKSGLILETSLQTFFYDHLLELNKKSSNPLPNETIHYSSKVMDRYVDSHKYFEIVDGKVREKTLGLKLLESSHLPRTSQKNALKDVGDTALLICGCFSESLNKKLTDTSYYQNLGEAAYRRLDNFVPDVYEMPAFYSLLSKSFFKLTLMMTMVFSHDNKMKTGYSAASVSEDQAPLTFIISDIGKIKIS